MAETHLTVRPAVPLVPAGLREGILNKGGTHMGAPSPPVPAWDCEKCGVAVIPGTAFCAGCGAAVLPAAPLPSSTPVPDAVAGPAGVVVPPAGYVSWAPERQKFSFWVPGKIISVPVVAGLAPFYMERGAPA